MAKARNYFAWQSRMVMRELGQRVVEVGCGIGTKDEAAEIKRLALNARNCQARSTAAVTEMIAADGAFADYLQKLQQPIKRGAVDDFLPIPCH